MTANGVAPDAAIVHSVAGQRTRGNYRVGRKVFEPTWLHITMTCSRGDARRDRAGSDQHCSRSAHLPAVTVVALDAHFRVSVAPEGSADNATSASNNGVTLLTSCASGDCRVSHRDDEPRWLYESFERSIGDAKRVRTTNEQRASNSGVTLFT